MLSILKKKYSILFVGLLIIFFNSLYYVVRNKTTPDLKCKSIFTVENKEKGLRLPVTAILVLTEKGLGILQIEGSLHGNTLQKRVIRIVRFNYKKINDGVMFINNLRVQKYSGDNVDDAVFNESIFDLNQSATHFLTISNLDNTLLLGNAYSPVFICEETN